MTDLLAAAEILATVRGMAQEEQGLVEQGIPQRRVAKAAPAVAEVVATDQMLGEPEELVAVAVGLWRPAAEKAARV